MANSHPLLPFQRFASPPPTFPALQEGDMSGLHTVVAGQVVEVRDDGLSLRVVTEEDDELDLDISIVGRGVAHIRLKDAAQDDSTHISLARQMTEKANSVVVERHGARVFINSDAILVIVELDPLRIQYCRPDRRPFLIQNHTDSDVTDYLRVLPLGYTTLDDQRLAFHDTFTCEPDEHFYGFGEKFTDFDKRGQLIEMWHYDAFGAGSERAYKNVPFFVSSRGYGVFVDSIRRVNFDMAYSNTATWSLIVPDTMLDYYVINGPDPKLILHRYAQLVSFPKLPPKWAFGLWLSSGFQRDSTEEVIARAKTLRDHAIPTDVLHLDCYWQRFGMWSENLWDLEMFPDPSSLIRRIKEMGFRVCLWINSYIGHESEVFREAQSKGYLLKTPQGDPYVTALWGRFHPPVGIIDMTNPQAVTWFKAMLRPHLRMGVDVYKSDFGEGVPADAVAYNGMSGETLHNLYPLLYNDAVMEVTEEETGRSGMVWGRSTYAGGQRHAAQWGGDPNTTYLALASTLRGGLSMGMCGHAFWSHDIGGFHRQPTTDIYVRWAQFGLLSPLSRAHGMTTRLPWEYGAEAERIFRQYAELRYRLLPYIYTLASVATTSGVPMLRAMILEFPGDPVTYTLDLQYMFGPDLLVAPIYNQSGERSVYLPAGLWIDFWTRQLLTGPSTVHVKAPLNILPLYVRANALVPTTSVTQFIGDAPFDLVVFDGYLLDAGNAEMHDSNGVTQLAVRLEGGQLDVRLAGTARTVGVRLIPLPGRGPVNEITVNGHPLDRLDEVMLAADGAIGWSILPNGAIEALLEQ